MNEIPLWQRLTAAGYLIIITIGVWAFWSRLPADFWPIDAARVSPNILATIIQIALYAPIAYLLWPPVRRRVHGYITGHIEQLHAHLDVLHNQREKHHAEQMAKLDEIHSHLKKLPADP